MPQAKLTIGTRGSKLALWQANWVKAQLESAHAGLEVELQIIKTTGDKITDVPLAQVGGKGLFVKEIEEALLDGRVDLAVHSMKDVPTVFPDGLGLVATSEREDPRDALLSHSAATIRDLSQGARVGTASLRRQAQLLRERPDLEIVSLRGNLDTRLRKLAEGEFEAILLAHAGLRRLGWALDIAHPIPIEEMVPAIGQGALGLETRLDDATTRERIAFLNHPDSADAVAAERALLARLEGGCQVPIAAHATIDGDRITLRGLVADETGSRFVTSSEEGPRDEAAILGREVAEDLLANGADAILADFYDRGA
jgi:hydroxymethylbilane synthase